MISLDEEFFGWVNGGDPNAALGTDDEIALYVRHVQSCGVLLVRTTNCIYGFHFTVSVWPSISSI